jgi:hypothetical protein
MTTTSAPSSPAPASALVDLYEKDETAWLDAMSELVAQRRFAEMDYQHLGEYLSDMANRDRREVRSRMTTLMTHLLKWKHQPNKRTRSWRGTIIEQRQELEADLEAGSLRNHAKVILDKAYALARKRAAGETGLDLKVFPSQCPWELDDLLKDE